MKKVVIMLVMLFTMSVYSFAEDNNASVIKDIEKYELKINHRQLACVLDLNKDQMESIDWILTDLENGMLFAASMHSEESRDKIIYNTITNNVRCMRYFLSEEQYKKYLMLLNTTLRNKGIIVKNENK